MTREAADDLRGYIVSRVSADENGCWIWTGYVAPNGYGKLNIKLRGRKRQLWAHRVSYEAFKGEPPAGLVIDHLCRVTNCCNPDHLEAVTYRENIMRGTIGQKTACPQGHLYSEHRKTYPNGVSRCMECHRIHERNRYKPRRSA